MDGHTKQGVWVWPIGWKKHIFCLFLLLPTWHSVDALNTAGRGGSGLVWYRHGCVGERDTTRHGRHRLRVPSADNNTTGRAWLLLPLPHRRRSSFLFIFVGSYLIHTDFSYFCITIDYMRNRSNSPRAADPGREAEASIVQPRMTFLLPHPLSSPEQKTFSGQNPIRPSARLPFSRFPPTRSRSSSLTFSGYTKK